MGKNRQGKYPSFFVYLIILFLLLLISFTLWNKQAAGQPQRISAKEELVTEYPVYRQGW